MLLYHISGWQSLASAESNQECILKPGTQCAEGIGVYFSEDAPRLSAAEGAQGRPSAIIAIEVHDNSGWWQSKGGKAKKFGKPRTWHSSGKSVCCRVAATETITLDGQSVPMLHCTWQWA